MCKDEYNGKNDSGLAFIFMYCHIVFFIHTRYKI